MKKFKIMLVILIFLASMLSPLVNTDEEREAAIKKVVLDYINGWYEGNVERMKNALHSSYLDKKGIFVNPKTGDVRVVVLKAQKMFDYTKAGGGKNFKGKVNNKVILLDVYDNIATVKTVSPQYIDYLHLAKFKEGWKIVNVLWEFNKNRKKPEK